MPVLTPVKLTLSNPRYGRILLYGGVIGESYIIIFAYSILPG